MSSSPAGGSGIVDQQQQQREIQQIQYVCTLLNQLTQPDTNVIRNAELQIKPILKDPQSMHVLWKIIIHNHSNNNNDAGGGGGSAGSSSTDIYGIRPSIAVRHVATILLRKRLPTHYSNFPSSGELKLQWQNEILAGLAAESERPVRTGLVGVIAAIANVEQTPTQPVLQFLAAAVNHTDPVARELCFLLLAEMTDTVGVHWKEHLYDLQQLFANTLNNGQEVIQVHRAAITALGQLMSYWVDETTEIESLAPLLPIMLQVTSQHSFGTTNINNVAAPGGNDTNRTSNSSAIDEDLLTVVLDFLYDLAYSPSSSLQQHMPLVINFALQCLMNRSLELRVRDAAALVIATMAEAKPKTFGRNTYVLHAVLDALFQMMQESSESAAGALFESNPTWRQDLLEEKREQRAAAAAAAGVVNVATTTSGMDDDDDVMGGDDDDFDSPTETSMAQGTLDMLACEIPKKYIWNACWERCLVRMSNPNNDAAVRKAGVAGLGVIAEGCCDPLTAALPTVLPYVFAAAQDTSNADVRECACFCLGQISEHCQPDILQYSTQILPTVFALLDDNSVAVQATSCYVLEMFCERLEPEAVRPLLDPLVRKLAHMLGVTNKRSVQEMAVAALAATAVAAEDEFIPYVSGIAQLLTPLMQLTDPTLHTLRGRALECMGHMAIAVGRDTFRPYFHGTMQCATDGIQQIINHNANNAAAVSSQKGGESTSSSSSSSSNTDLQEFAYAVFANLAKVMKEEFAPVLPDLVPHLIRVIEQDEGQLIEKASSDTAATHASTSAGTITSEGSSGTGGGGGGGVGIDDSNKEPFQGLDDSDNEDDNGQYILNVRTALLEVKKGAITALGEMAAHTGTHFCPYLESCMQVLQKASTNWHPLIKCEVADAFPSMIMPSIAAYHDGEIKWKKISSSSSSTSSSTDDAASSPTKTTTTTTNDDVVMSAHTSTIVGAVLVEEITLCKDEEKSVVGKACEAIQTVIELCGPHALAPVASECMSAAHDILCKTSPCQTAEVMYGELPDDDDDHDNVMQAACDLIGAFCRVMGKEHFTQYLPQFLPAICEYAKPSRPSTDRAMAIGCLSEIVQEVQEHIAQHWSTIFMPAIISGLVDDNDNDDNCKRNAAFLAGICCEHMKLLATPTDYQQILQHLSPIFAMQQQQQQQDDSGNSSGTMSDAASACLDNCAAAVARMIMAAPQHIEPTQFPIIFMAFLSVLPLKTDMTENETVYNCILGLIHMKHPDVVSQSNKIIHIFQQACLDDSNVDDDIKVRLRNAMVTLNHK